MIIPLVTYFIFYKVKYNTSVASIFPNCHMMISILKGDILQIY